MLRINDKCFMNLQEAVAWLLANNPLPFQCDSDFMANTEIAKSAIINPSPAQIKVGALVLFADSKVGTVSAVTSNGFMVGPNFTDISNALRYITGININASAHLIVDLSDHTQIDAGLIREITSFEIDASAHLIAYYNDGSSDDLGALNLYESIRDQNGHLRFVEDDGNPSDIAGLTSAFCKWSLSGSHLMMVFAGSIANGSEIAGQSNLSAFTLPSWIADKIYPVFANIIELKEVTFYGDDYTTETKNVFVLKSGNDIIFRYASSLPYSLTKDRHFRIVCDLLIDND